MKKIFGLFLVFLFLATNVLGASPLSNVRPALYPEYSHRHFVWLSRERSNDTNIREFVNGFLKRDIPVGGIDVDSGWSTGFNNYEIDKSKFPDMKGFISDMNNLGIEVIFWTTSFINEDSSNYKEGKEKGYFLSDGALIKWWHGTGALLDYSNEDALKWWHKQLDNILDLGAAGFKCDGSDPYAVELVVPVGRGGDILPRMYSERYYRDFYRYSRSKNPNAVLMARPIDSFDAMAFIEFAPRDVLFFGWVGDQDPTWDGMKDCIQNVFHSAWNAYVSFGCDIGGYRSGDKTRTAELFLRWAQLGAFLPVMENGGDGYHNPWHYDSDDLNVSQIYSKFAHIHEEMTAYLVTAGSEAFEKGSSILKPLELETGETPTEWGYYLGKDFLVYPVVEPALDAMKIFLPNETSWTDYWTGKRYSGGQTITYPLSMDIIPVFQRKNSLIPLRVTRGSVTGHGVYAGKAITFMMNGIPIDEFADVVEVREWEGTGVRVFYSVEWSAKGMKRLNFRFSDHEDDIVFVVKNCIGEVAKMEIRYENEKLAEKSEISEANGLRTPSYVAQDGDLHISLPKKIGEAVNVDYYANLDIYYQLKL